MRLLETQMLVWLSPSDRICIRKHLSHERSAENAISKVEKIPKNAIIVEKWQISQRADITIFHNYMNSPENNSGGFLALFFSPVSFIIPFSVLFFVWYNDVRVLLIIRQMRPRSPRQAELICKSEIMKSMNSSSQPGQGRITSRIRMIWALRIIPST